MPPSAQTSRVTGSGDATGGGDVAVEAQKLQATLAAALELGLPVVAHRLEGAWGVDETDGICLALSQAAGLSPDAFIIVYRRQAGPLCASEIVLDLAYAMPTQ